MANRPKNQKVTRVVRPPLHKKVLYAGGLGDLLALDFFLAISEREVVEEAWLVGPHAGAAATLFSLIFPGATVQQFPPHVSIGMKARNRTVVELVHQRIVDVPIDCQWLRAKRYQELASRGRIATKTTGHVSAALPASSLSGDYTAVHLTTSKARSGERNLTNVEFELLQSLAETQELVLLGDPGPQFPWVQHDLRGKLSITESLAVVRSARGFLGCASSLSVLAGLHLPERTLIKCGSQVTRLQRGFWYPWMQPSNLRQQIAMSDVRRVLGV